MFTAARRNVLRYTRRLARTEGVVLGRFRMIPGSDESSLGTEWVAVAVRGDAIAKVWCPIGDENLNEALRTCSLCRSFDGYVFGISITGNASLYKRGMRTVTTPLGVFPVTRRKAVGISVYKAGRAFMFEDRWLEPGQYFSATHTRPDLMLRRPYPLWRGVFVAYYDLNGCNVTPLTFKEPHEWTIKPPQ